MTTRKMFPMTMVCLVAAVVVTMVMSACGARRSFGNVLQGTWTAVEACGVAIATEPADERPTMTLHGATGDVTGRTGCNSYFGRFNHDAGQKKLSFSHIGATQRLCHNEETERRFLSALEQTKRYEVADGRLKLLSENGTVVAVLSKEP